MQAGMKLDELVARHVLQWRLEGSEWVDERGGRHGERLKPYSTDIAAAWEIADFVCEFGYRLRVEGARLWNARFYKSAAHTLETHAISTVGSTPAEAICLAALAMKGVDTKEEPAPKKRK